MEIWRHLRKNTINKLKVQSKTVKFSQTSYKMAKI
jgi:hypothetical protein